MFLGISISSDPVSSKPQEICIFPFLQGTVILVDGYTALWGRLGRTLKMCTVAMVQDPSFFFFF